MKIRSFLILCAVTVVMVIAAAVSVTRVDRATTVAGAGEKLFPDLPQQVDALTTIRVRDGERTLTIERRDDGWGLAEKNGYPVALDKVRGTVVALAQFEKVEAKTSEPDRYPKLQVEDVDAENAQSKELILIAEDGQTLADLIVGKFAFGVGEGGGLYVRKPDEDRAWLVRGQLDVGLEPRDWIERRIVDVPAADVRQVVVLHPDGETIEAAKETRDDVHLALKNLPDGAKAKRPGGADALASVLSGLDLDDIEPADTIPFDPDKTVRASVGTFDGLSVMLDLTEHDGGKWIRLTAKTRGADGGDRPGDEATEAAQALTARTQGWVYRIPAYKTAPLEKRLADFADLSPPGS